MGVDLRSDTVTRPTAEMRRAMAEADVGDDQYGEDPTVNALQEAFAALLGKPAALYVPSGTMANQVAIRVLTRPGDAVVAGARQHVILYEDGAGSANAGVMWLPIDDGDGTLAPEELDVVAGSDAYHHPRPAAVFLENTHMASGGRTWPASRLAEVAAVAARHRLPVHLDGARLWNAAVANDVSLDTLAAPATTVMCCLSKGLCAPVGSVLAGPEDMIDEARLHRARLGGAMRQAGVIAAAGLVALRSMRQRLADDHHRAARLAEAAAERWPDGVVEPREVETNIVLLRPPDAASLLAHLDSSGVQAGMIAPGVVRLVTHADVDDDGIDTACKALSSAP
jgi:threonine aldolase